MIAQTNADNWAGIHPNTKNAALPGGTKEGLKSTTEFEVIAPTTHSAEMAYEKVLEYAGASLNRDVIDARIVNDVKKAGYTFTGSNGSTNGLIDTQSDTEGYILYESTTKPTDANNDGIADAWAEAHMPNGATYNSIDAATGYSYLELYINSLVDHIMKAGCEGVEDSPSKNDFDLTSGSTGIENIYNEVDKPILYNQNGLVYLSNVELGSTIYIYGINGQCLNTFKADNTNIQLDIHQSSIVKVQGSKMTTTFKTM